MNYQKFTLNNGMTVVMEEIPFVRSVSFGVWIKNGSRNEGLSLNGVSHFIEHMLFKGTGSRSARQIADEMDAVGGQLNAYTTKEYTCFYARTLDTHFGVALSVISDMIMDPKFDAADIDKERNVILEEINMMEDSPEDLVHDLLESCVFSSQDLSLPVLGAKETVSNFDRNLFIEFFAAKYHPENMVVALAGNVRADAALKEIENVFGFFKRPEAFIPPVYDAVYTPGRLVKEKDIEQVHITIGFPGVKTGADESYPLSILNAVFGGGMSSRLFQKIREEHGLSYAIFSYNVGFMDAGLFSICAALAADQVDRAMDLILEEIRRLFTEKIDETALNKSKEQIKSGYMLSLESSSSRMSSIGRSELLLNRIIPPEELLDKINAVELAHIYDLAERIFTPGAMSIAAVGAITAGDLAGYAY